MHTGHQWLISKSMFQDIFQIRPPKTLLDLVVDHESEIHYVPVETPTILQDVDTHKDYETYRP